MHDRLERIESVKAGSLAGATVGISYCLMMIVDRLVWAESDRSIIALGWEFSTAIISGFLFGVTYRYIIRIDRNDHLNAGAVLAFGLVRGLAQVDLDKFELVQIQIAGLVVSKSILLFSIARYTLDFALATSWILPFGQHLQDLSISASKDELEREFAANLVDGLKK
jgi:hypothetical protein